MDCPACGGLWDLDEDPDECPSCRISMEDLDTAAAFLWERDSIVPPAKCDECGTLLTAVEIRHGERTGHCPIHGRVIAVDQLRT